MLITNVNLKCLDGSKKQRKSRNVAKALNIIITGINARAIQFIRMDKT
jgi:hypothetical protein